MDRGTLGPRRDRAAAGTRRDASVALGGKPLPGPRAIRNPAGLPTETAPSGSLRELARGQAPGHE
jgi:hypothetical protein